MTCYDIVVDSEWTLTYLTICNLKMNCYNIVVDFSERLTYSMICNLRIACYEIVVDFDWTVNLYNESWLTIS